VDAARSRRVGSAGTVLSYFRSYFDPEAHARFANHSTGLIARHLYDLLSPLGPVAYFGSKERPEGLEADLFIGHFWAFAELCERNDFATKIAFYSVSDPVETRRLLAPLAERFRVPMPDWDLPPPSFDHERTMDLADLVFVVGNTYTLNTFPERWRSKIVLLNYSIDRDLFDLVPDAEARNEFCYVATHCGLRKGFVDVIEIGNIAPPFDRMLAESNNGSIVYHGWIDSDSARYQQIIKQCRFAHVPTYSEGQMGTLLELIHSGCVPITTAASGVDDEVLAHCLVVEPLDVDGQRAAIHRALSWSPQEYAIRQRELLDATRRQQTWESFDARVRSALRGQLAPTGAR
jgi:glycosyltransferase involved in cell wall biosynthesis